MRRTNSTSLVSGAGSTLGLVFARYCLEQPVEVGGGQGRRRDRPHGPRGQGGLRLLGLGRFPVTLVPPPDRRPHLLERLHHLARGLLVELVGGPVSLGLAAVRLVLGTDLPRQPHHAGDGQHGDLRDERATQAHDLLLQDRQPPRPTREPGESPISSLPSHSTPPSRKSNAGRGTMRAGGTTARCKLARKGCLARRISVRSRAASLGEDAKEFEASNLWPEFGFVSSDFINGFLFSRRCSLLCRPCPPWFNPPGIGSVRHHALSLLQRLTDCLSAFASFYSIWLRYVTFSHARASARFLLNTVTGLSKSVRSPMPLLLDCACFGGDSGISHTSLTFPYDYDHAWSRTARPAAR